MNFVSFSYYNLLFTHKNFSGGLFCFGCFVVKCGQFCKSNSDVVYQIKFLLLIVCVFLRKKLKENVFSILYKKNLFLLSCVLK